MKHTNRVTKRAFTLIELLIVIAIIGILFVVLVSKVDFATDKAKATGVQTMFRSYQMALETVTRDNAGFAMLGWDTGDTNGNHKRDSYDEGDTNKNGIMESTETWTGHKVPEETWTGTYTLINPMDSKDASGFRVLEDAINANLDPYLYITIVPDVDADNNLLGTATIQMANSARDPWGKEYHGYYITNATVDDADRGAIVIYSDGVNGKWGSEHKIQGGKVSITVPGNNINGQDDYAMAVFYTFANDFGEIAVVTNGFSNNKTFLSGNGNNGGSIENIIPGGQSVAIPNHGTIILGDKLQGEDVDVTYDETTNSIIINSSDNNADIEDIEDIPEAVRPNVLQAYNGVFNSIITHVPAEYQTITYEESTTYVRKPGATMTVLHARDVMYEPYKINDINLYFGDYIIYSLRRSNGDELLWMHNEIVLRQFNAFEIGYYKTAATLEDVIYYAAFKQMECRQYGDLNLDGSPISVHLAKWNGSYYEYVDYDAQINAIKDFTVTETTTVTKTIQTQAASASGVCTYVETDAINFNEGMTWNEWLNSSYNTKYDTTAVVRDADGNKINKNAVIESGKQYAIRNLITFYVDGESYVAEEGMTWHEWAKGEYDTKTFNFLTEYSGVSAQFMYVVCDENDQRALPQHVIIAKDYFHLDFRYY